MPKAAKEEHFGRLIQPKVRHSHIVYWSFPGSHGTNMFRIWNFIGDVKRLGLVLRIVERKRACECWLDEWLSCEGMQTHSIDSSRFMPCRSMPGFIGRDMLQVF